MKRSEVKKRARESVKKHYGILLVVCLIASFLGAEFTASLDFVKQYRVDAIESSEGEDNKSQESVSTGATTGSHKATYMIVMSQALSGNLDEAQKTAQSIVNEDVEETKLGEGNPALGRSRGALASIVNDVTSGSIIVTIMKAAQNLGVATDVILIVSIIIALLVAFLVWFFLINMYQAVSRRVFLESRIYEKVTVQRMLVFLRVKRWKNVSVVMFMKSIFLALWSLTIVGGIIKRYSYYMVPYIVAENPSICWKDAITLSRNMMQGHKMECFMYELSFIPWNILGTFTLGVVNLFYVNQYKIATYSEYYAQLRELAKEQEIAGSNLMNDKYLFEKADTETLAEAYQDIEKLTKVQDEQDSLTGFSAFMANVFGITVISREDEKKYEANEERKIKIQLAKDVLAGRSYPSRLSVVPETQKNSRVEHIHYLRRYSVSSLILLFFIFSFIGWTWEVSLHLIHDGVFVNRGVLHGPWLPIYGAGGVLILIVLNKLREKPVFEFFAAVILCGCVEYFTSYYLEITHGGQKWWDYSGYFLNLNGRICAEGLLVFGIGGMAIVYAVAPLLDNYLRMIKFRYAVPLCAILLILFGCDQIYSNKHPNMGKGITDYTGAYVMNEPETISNYWKGLA